MYGRCRSGSPAAFRGSRAEVALELGERAVHVDARVSGVVALPHRDRRAPVPVAADRPVARAGDPLAELPVLHVLGHPVDVLVQLAHAVAELGHADEPARDRLVDERVAAAPAVRVRSARSSPGGAGGPRPCSSCVSGLFASLQSSPATSVHRRQEPPAVVEREDHRDAGRLADLLVLLAVGGRLVHDARAVLRRDVVGDEDLPGVLHAVLLDVGVVVEEPVVA